MYSCMVHSPPPVPISPSGSHCHSATSSWGYHLLGQCLHWSGTTLFLCLSRSTWSCLPHCLKTSASLLYVAAGPFLSFHALSIAITVCVGAESQALTYQNLMWNISELVFLCNKSKKRRNLSPVRNPLRYLRQMIVRARLITRSLLTVSRHCGPDNHRAEFRLNTCGRGWLNAQ